jgi:peptidoglycan L-alanyl-D-glutamate endopeptidase CwlK
VGNHINRSMVGEMNPSTIARLDQLFPTLAEKGYALIRQLAAQGIDVEVSQGMRTWPEQTALWQEGRNPDGSYIDPIHETGVVTHAKAGQSWHNYGCAFDIDIQTTAGGLDWTGTSPAWVATIAAGESLGLVSGSEWHGKQQDRPHFQLVGRFPVTPDDEVLILFRGGGIQAVWDEIGKSLLPQL